MTQETKLSAEREERGRDTAARSGKSNEAVMEESQRWKKGSSIVGERSAGLRFGS